MATLRRLLFSQEQAELERLKQEVEASRLDSDSLSQLLPRAVTKAQARDGRLVKSLSPLIGDSLRSSIQRDPQSIVDAISPIMGPAIRDAIRQAIRGMVQSLNKTLEYSVSWKGLKWRWEAVKTGKSFAEVVLLHTLIYRVSQVFLIHRKTGLLIRHEALNDDVRDVDLASGMLTAIQDFVRDSFGAGDDESLRSMVFGNQNVRIETGPHAFLAAVVEGEAPARVRVGLRECVENIHIDFAEELATFNGDDSRLVATESPLRECLDMATEADERDGPSEKKSSVSVWLRGAVAAVLATGLTVWAVHAFHVHRSQTQLREARRFLAAPDSVEIVLRDGVLTASGSARNDWIVALGANATRLATVNALESSQLENQDAAWLRYVDAVRKVPGLIVLRSARENGRYVVDGLRDPVAIDPLTILSKYDVNPNEVDARWRHFQSLDPTLLPLRLNQALGTIPKGVELQFEGSTLRATGTASSDWINSLKFQTRVVGAGQIKLDDSQLADVGVQHLRDLRNRMEEASIRFESGVDTIEPGQDDLLSKTADDLQKLFATAERLKNPIRVTIIGYAGVEELESGESPTRLSQQRARRLWKALQKMDVPVNNLVIQGQGAATPATGTTEQESEDKQYCRFNVRYALEN